MNALRAGNLAIRFFLELCALAAVAYWGATTATGRMTRIRTMLAESYAVLAVVSSVLVLIWPQQMPGVAERVTSGK
jgi:hypothetical protein